MVSSKALPWRTGRSRASPARAAVSNRSTGTGCSDVITDLPQNAPSVPADLTIDRQRRPVLQSGQMVH